MEDLERREVAVNKSRAAISHVLTEREYQKKMWGSDNDAHTTQDWASIIAVYSGKVSRTVNPYGENKGAFRKRLVQLTAVCLAALEAELEE